MEIDPAYVDVAIERWQAATGHAAILAGTNTTFADIRVARAVVRTKG